MVRGEGKSVYSDGLLVKARLERISGNGIF